MRPSVLDHGDFARLGLLGIQTFVEPRSNRHWHTDHGSKSVCKNTRIFCARIKWVDVKLCVRILTRKPCQL